MGRRGENKWRVIKRRTGGPRLDREGGEERREGRVREERGGVRKETMMWGQEGGNER